MVPLVAEPNLRAARQPLPAGLHLELFTLLISLPSYDELLAGISELLDRARRTTARTVNAIITAAYWEVGRRIVEFEQRANSAPPTASGCGSAWRQTSPPVTGGFSKSNITLMRAFHLRWEIFQTASGRFVGQVK